MIRRILYTAVDGPVYRIRNLAGGGAMLATAFLTARGARQGDIKGDVTLKGREGSIALVSVAHALDAPYDAATGQMSGKRQHKPVMVATRIDQATPRLIAAMVANETLTTAKIEFWRDAPELSTPYFVIVLTNAAIVEVSLAPADAGDHRSELVKVALVYQKIEWTFDSGDSASDSWVA